MNKRPDQEQELDLRSYLRPIWRRRWMILVITLVAGVATYCLADQQAKSYTATSSLDVQNVDPSAPIGEDLSPTPLIDQIGDVAQLLTSHAIAVKVARQFHLSPSAAAASVSVTPSSTSSFVTVNAQARSGVLAADLANAYVADFVASQRRAAVGVAQANLQAAQTTLDRLPGGGQNSIAAMTQRESLLTQMASDEVTILRPDPGVQRINAATVPGSPSSPRPLKDAVFAAMIGLTLAVIAAFGLEYWDPRLTSLPSIESIFERPILAVLPHVSDPAPLAQGNLPTVPLEFVEELRSLAIMLQLSGGDTPPRSILITSMLPAEGKSTVTRDLALVYADDGMRVLVINADRRRPSIGRMFGITEKRGMVKVARGERAGSISLLLQSDSNHSPTLLSSDLMAKLITSATGSYDIVLIDTPPTLVVADSLPLLELADSVILVARVGQTSRDAARRFCAIIARLNVNFSGVIVNDRHDPFQDGYGSYGTYGEHYGREGKRLDRGRRESDKASATDA